MTARVPGPVMATAAVLGASCSLAAVFGDARWVWPVVGAAIVASACGAAVRRWPLPVLVAGLLPATAFVAYVTAVFARHTAILGFIPTGRTWGALQTTLQEAASDIRVLVAPVPAKPGLVLLAVTAVFTVSGVVDILVTFLGRPALAGFPLLLLFAVPAMLARHPLGPAAFIAAAVGYVGLLLVQRNQTPNQAPGRPPNQAAGSAAAGARTARDNGAAPWAGVPGPQARLSAAAQPVGIIAVCLAVAAPLALPLQGSGLLSARTGSAAPSDDASLSPVVALNAQLHSNDPRPLMTVRADSPSYLRLTALDVFDGTTFRPATTDVASLPQLQAQVPGEDAVVPRQRVSVDVFVSQRLRGRYLPVPWPVSTVSVGGHWRYDEATSTVVSGSSDTAAGLNYSATAEVPKPTPAQIAAVGPPSQVPAPLTKDLDLPDSLDGQVRTLANRLTDGVSSAYGKAEAIEQYLRGPEFTYDLNGAPASADTALTRFLLQTHRGYCVQYATSMVVLARVAGIPARLAIGYAPGIRVQSGRYQVRAVDAHAWPELWFPELGWIRFEPTPPARDAAQSAPAPAPSTATDAPGQGQPSDAASGGDTGQDSQPGTPGTASGPAQPPEGSDGVQTPDRAGIADLAPTALQQVVPAAAAARSAGLLGSGSAVPNVALAVLLAGVLLAPPALRWRRRRQRLREGRPDQLWDELSDTLVDLGLPPLRQDTVRTLRARLAGHLSAEGTAALERLGAALERARFAPPGTAGPRAGDACSAQDVAVLRAELARSQGLQRRARAAFAPPSILSSPCPVSRTAGDPRDPWAPVR